MVRTQRFKNSPTPEDELNYYFVRESNLIAGDACLKLKYMTETILADAVVNSSSSHVMQKFKKNLEHFQFILPFYMRLGFNDTLLKTYINLVKDYPPAPLNNDKDLVYIRKLLKDVDFQEMQEEYVKDIKNILPKLESFKNNISDTLLINWLENFKKCGDWFECYLNSYQKYTYTTKDHFVGFLQKQLSDMTISFVANANVISKRILQDKRLSQLSPFYKNNVKENMEYALNVAHGCENIYHLFWIPPIYDSLKSMYTSDEIIPLDDLFLIIKIFNENGYDDLMSNFRANYDKFLQYDVVKEYERAKRILSPAELVRDKQFWNTFEKLKEAATFEERYKIANAANKVDFSEIKI